MISGYGRESEAFRLIFVPTVSFFAHQTSLFQTLTADGRRGTRQCNWLMSNVRRFEPLKNFGNLREARDNRQSQIGSIQRKAQFACLGAAEAKPPPPR